MVYNQYDNKYSILSTFTGCGGIDIGFKGGFSYLGKNYPKLPFKTSFAIDLNPSAIASLNNNPAIFGDTKCVSADIVSYDMRSIPNPGYDILLGGFPCVTFSMAGKRRGITDDINGKLYESYASYVEFFRPKVFVAENVKGILSANKGEALRVITERFEGTGYRVSVHKVNFADYGVPQLRERVLFIGVRDNINGDFIAPLPINKNERVTSSQAFSGLPQDCPNHIHANVTERTREILQAIPPGGNFRDLPPHFEVKGMMSNIYRRLHPDTPSYTVISNGGGGAHHYHYAEPRPLTNRERARLQAFPDSFIFAGSMTQIKNRLGMQSRLWEYILGPLI